MERVESVRNMASQTFARGVQISRHAPMYGKILIAIIVIMLAYAIWSMVKARKENILHYRQGKIAKKIDKIKDQHIRRSPYVVEFTYHMFIYINDWDYGIYWIKTILKKSQNNTEFAPIAYFTPIKNDLTVCVTSDDNKNNSVTVEDFPLKRWTHMAIVVNDSTLEVYVGGLLAKSLNMGGSAKLNNGDLEICPWGGFGGYLSKFSYVPRAMTGKEVYEYSRRAILLFPSLNIFGMKLGMHPQNFMICKANYEKPKESDLDHIPPESAQAFSKVQPDMGTLGNYKSFLKKVGNKVNQAERVSAQNCTSNADTCPTYDNAPLCPVGTLACSENQQYCYYPDRDMMVSTYMDEDEDYCPAKGTGNKDGNIPFQIGGINVWKRKDGKDFKDCSNLK